MKRTFVTAIAVLGFAFAASAQQMGAPPPDNAPPAAPPAAAAPPPAAAVPQSNTKPVDCRAQAREKGLRGPAIRDAMTICREEQRLACTKEAVERNIPNAQRRDFIRNCATRGGGNREDRG
jgi:hypothetical protein